MSSDFGLDQYEKLKDDILLNYGYEGLEEEFDSMTSQIKRNLVALDIIGRYQVSLPSVATYYKMSKCINGTALLYNRAMKKKLTIGQIEVLISWMKDVGWICVKSEEES